MFEKYLQDGAQRLYWALKVVNNSLAKVPNGIMNFRSGFASGDIQNRFQSCWGRLVYLGGTLRESAVLPDLGWRLDLTPVKSMLRGAGLAQLLGLGANRPAGARFELKST